MCVLKSVSRIQPFATLWMVTHQAPLSIGFFRQDYWTGLPFPPPEDLPNPGSNSCVLRLLHWWEHSLPLSHVGSPMYVQINLSK